MKFSKALSPLRSLVRHGGTDQPNIYENLPAHCPACMGRHDSHRVASIAQKITPRDDDARFIEAFRNGDISELGGFLDWDDECDLWHIKALHCVKENRYFLLLIQSSAAITIDDKLLESVEVTEESSSTIESFKLIREPDRR